MKGEQKPASDIIEFLTELQEDSTIPKNVKAKIGKVAALLADNQELKVRVNKALHMLDDISSDGNLEPFVRTQLWNVASMLEKLS